MGLRGECEGSFGGSQELERVGVLWEQTERGESWGCVKSGVSCQEETGTCEQGGQVASTIKSGTGGYDR